MPRRRIVAAPGLFDAPASIEAPIEDATAPDNRLDAPLRELLLQVPPAWRSLTAAFADSEAGRRLCDQVDARRDAGVEIYPKRPLRALPDGGAAAVRVVILGQDPYHGPGEAEGLAFSVPPGVKRPPSLRNIHQEMGTDLGLPIPSHGSLAAWVEQGVLLLNTSLTVERDRPASHARLGWELLTDAVVRDVAAGGEPCVFLLWGAHAQAKAALIESVGVSRHAVLMSNHPSPLSARRPPVPFLGSRPFSRANACLRAWGRSEVDWRIPPNPV
jgi:uracil-DNA glycosylase